MEKILNVAQYIIDSYKRITDEDIDELKLHKLLYFSQRESLAVMGTPLFEENLEGWVHGPVSPSVRSHFELGIGITVSTDNLSDTSKTIVDSVMNRYCQFASWKLRELSHNEVSWINSRNGLLPNERGNNILSIDDIRKDSEKVDIPNELFDISLEPYSSHDPFYDEENIIQLKKSIAEMEKHGGNIHEVLND